MIRVPVGHISGVFGVEFHRPVLEVDAINVMKPFIAQIQRDQAGNDISRTGAEVRLGTNLVDRDQRGTSAPAPSWYFFVGADNEALVWNVADKKAMNGVALRDQATVGDLQGGIEEAERLADEVAVMHRGRTISRGKPGELIAEHAGRETAEVYGPPDRLAEARALAESEGLRVRPAGPAIAIVGSEAARNGAVPDDAVRRAATLEDVFVLLTGEEAE